jgi:FMN phosphatase YigB (HAD superfamily)
VLKKLGLAPQQSMYMADSALKDNVGARDLAMLTVLLLQPDGEYAAEAAPDEGHGPHVTIGAITELTQLLRSMETA